MADEPSNAWAADPKGIFFTGEAPELAEAQHITEEFLARKGARPRARLPHPARDLREAAVKHCWLAAATPFLSVANASLMVTFEACRPRSGGVRPGPP